MERTSDSTPPRRADTLSSPDPYALPLTEAQRGELARLLGAFSVHGVVGLFCGVATMPRFVQPEAWIEELIHNVQFTNEAQFRRTIELVMRVYDHVIDVLGRGELSRLVPEPDDAAACRQWAHGYATQLVQLEPEFRVGEVIEPAFGIQAVAEVPQMLTFIDERYGADERAAVLTERRAKLADDAAALHAAWAEARATPAAAKTPIQVAPKPGRNDPCSCGSGKKFKKCCGG